MNSQATAKEQLHSSMSLASTIDGEIRNSIQNFFSQVSQDAIPTCHMFPLSFYEPQSPNLFESYPRSTL